MKKKVKKSESTPNQTDKHDKSWQIDALHQPQINKSKNNKKLNDDKQDKQGNSGLDEWSVSWP